MPSPPGNLETGLYDHNQLGWYGAEAYARRYLEFYRAIHPLVPPTTFILANGAEIDSFRNGTERYWPRPALIFSTSSLTWSQISKTCRTARHEKKTCLRRISRFLSVLLENWRTCESK